MSRRAGASRATEHPAGLAAIRLKRVFAYGVSPERAVATSFERIRRVVAKIPRGRVMTYGEVAVAAGMPGAARTVGYAMRALGRGLPWQRVLGRRNARSAHSTIRDPRANAEQRRLLEQEGVVFDARGGVSLAAFGWSPRRATPGVAKPVRKLLSSR